MQGQVLSPARPAPRSHRRGQSPSILPRDCLRRLAYVRSLRPLRALLDLELDYVAFLQALIALAGDRAVMHEHVGPILATDESVSLGVIEPFHSTFQTIHVRTSESVLVVWPIACSDRGHRLHFLPLCVR